jgi:hypothetical protein
MNFKPYFLPFVATFLVIVLVGLIVKSVFLKPANAGLKVNTIPSATIFLDGKEVGRTPFESETLKAGEKTLKIVPDQTLANFSPWEIKVKLVSGVETIVQKEFAENENQASSQVVTLETITDKKTASLMVVSVPDSAVVKIDNESKGFTPVSLDQLAEGEKDITLSAPGFKDENLKVKLYAGFKAILNVKLSQETEAAEVTPTPSITTSPTPSLKLTVTPTKGPTPTTPAKPYVEIKSTETGWLRVRADASKSSSELGKVYPGEKYSFLEEKNGWYKIVFGENKEGWISSAYATKVE